MTDTYEKCSCGDCPKGTPRQKSKCVKESKSGHGKMCLKELKAERQEALTKPNDVSIEDAFDYMFNKYEHVLEELSGK